MFFIESLQKWPKTAGINDDDVVDFDDGNSNRGLQQPRKLPVETFSDERLFDLLPQLFNPVLKVDVEAGDDAAFCLKV